MDPIIKKSFFTILIYWNDNRIHLGLTKKLIFFILFPPLPWGQGRRVGDLMESTGRFDGSSDVFKAYICAFI